MRKGQVVLKNPSVSRYQKMIHYMTLMEQEQ